MWSGAGLYLPDRLCGLQMAWPEIWSFPRFGPQKIMSESQILDIELEAIEFHCWTLVLLKCNCFYALFPPF